MLVRTAAVETYCPLLSKKKREKKTVDEVETEVRKILERHEAVKNVTAIRVLHINSALVSIQGIISVDEDMKVSDAKLVAQVLKKENIKQSAGIELAEINLDLCL